MRARAGDPPRTMTQKILAGRAEDPSLSSDLLRVKIDQVVLSREPERALSEALLAGSRKFAVEVAVAYRDALGLGLLLARPGIGFPAAVHLERFGSPARLAVTDDPRLASVGGAGMLSIVAPPAQLAEALSTGSIWLRRPRSVQVLLSGRVRPFVCVRDVGLELVRRGLGETIRRIDA